MEISNTYYAADRNEWRKWLQSHYNTEKEVLTNFLVSEFSHKYKFEPSYHTFETGFNFTGLEFLFPKEPLKNIQQKYFLEPPRRKSVLQRLLRK